MIIKIVIATITEQDVTFYEAVETIRNGDCSYL